MFKYCTIYYFTMLITFFQADWTVKDWFPLLEFGTEDFERFFLKLYMRLDSACLSNKWSRRTCILILFLMTISEPIWVTLLAERVPFPYNGVFKPLFPLHFINVYIYEI